jgi:hypothetical protein
MDGAFYCRSELSAPWGMTLDPMPSYLWFHVVTTGGALLEVGQDHARWLHPGDVALVPHANGHVLRSEGAVRFEHPVARNLVGILPAMLYIQASDEPRASWMQAVFKLMAAEARAFQPGGEAVITRLADVLVIQAIRAWIETAPAARGGWLGALQDPQIGQALALIHRDPARPWTIAPPVAAAR